MRVHEQWQEEFERKTPLASLSCPALREEYHEHYQELLLILANYHVEVLEKVGWTTLYFPQGTYTQRLFPVVTAERNQITIPGGLYLYQTETPAHEVVLLVPLKFFSQATQEKYAD